MSKIKNLLIELVWWYVSLLTFSYCEVSAEKSNNFYKTLKIYSEINTSI